MIGQPEVLYANISAENEPCVMESVCVQCEANGKTTLLLTKIPMFQDIIIVSFECEQCGYKNNEVQFGGQLKEQGVILTLNVTKLEDLSRQIVRSEQCVIKLPDLDFEMPSNKKGCISTLEGFLANIVEDLSTEQPIRKAMWPDVYEKIEVVLQKIRDMQSGTTLPFKWVMHDPSGNSYIQNLHYPAVDPNLKQQHYTRSNAEVEAMGYSVENTKQEMQQQKQQDEEAAIEKQKQQVKDEQLEQQTQQHWQDETIKQKKDLQNQIGAGTEQIQAAGQNFDKSIVDDIKQESLVFPAQCNACGQQGENKMCTISIPFFKDVLIMAFTCNNCGNKDTEVKSSGEITPYGVKITLNAQGPLDIRRDVFKSETASLEIPEIELELQYGTMGGMYSTVEGLLSQILAHLRDNNPFVGDSQESMYTKKLDFLFSKLEEYQTGTVPFTLIIKDLVDNSFIANPYHPEADRNVQIEKFARTADDDDHLGIDTMKTENYHS